MRPMLSWGRKRRRTVTTLVGVDLRHDVYETNREATTISGGCEIKITAMHLGALRQQAERRMNLMGEALPAGARGEIALALQLGDKPDDPGMTAIAEHRGNLLVCRHLMLIRDVFVDRAQDHRLRTRESERYHYATSPPFA